MLISFLDILPTRQLHCYDVISLEKKYVNFFSKFQNQ